MVSRGEWSQSWLTVLRMASVTAWAISACAVGCSTHSKRLASPRRAFYSNDLILAQQQLEKLSDKKSDRTVAQLDLALVDLLSGQPESAEQRLRDVRDEWDKLEKISIAESAASLIRDDQSRAYSGEDYEKVLLHVFLTLSSLMSDGVDAESYSLQTLSKQQEIVGKARQRDGDDAVGDDYCIPAIAPYMRGVLREATLGNYDDAVRSYRRSYQLQPTANFLLGDIERASNGVHSHKGHGVVYVIAMVGRGPYKREVEAVATQDALFIADRIISAVGEYSVPPTLAPVKVPGIVRMAKPFDLVGIEVNGQPATTTMPLTDLHALAERSIEQNLSETIAWAVARRVLKKGAVYTAKDHLGAEAGLASLAFDAAGVVWEATESADTRCWGVLPGEIQIARLELPVGTHLLNLEPVASGRPVAPGSLCEVAVADGRNAYVLAYWPDLKPIGQVLVRDAR